MRRDRPSPNHDVRTAPIDLVILHYTGMQSAEVALARLTDPEPISGRYPGPWRDPDAPDDAPLGRVSAHYLVAEDGDVFALVPEERRAWHAGAGVWAGWGALNDRSIGIEIANGGHDFGLPDFAEPQIEAVLALVREITARWGLGPAQVVGHSDVAPERKADPGEKFPWARLAAAGLALWPQAPEPARFAAGVPVAALQRGLAAFGYDVAASERLDGATEAAVRAFQRRFRPARVDGRADAETLAILDDLLRQRGLAL